MNESPWISVKPLLDEWHDKARQLQYQHYQSAKRFGKLNFYLGIPVVIFSTFVGTSVFAALQQKPDARLQILVGLISVVAAILAGLQTFLGYAERTEKYRVAGVKYGAIAREIETARVLPPEQAEEVKHLLDNVKKSMNDLAESSLPIPDVILRRTGSPKSMKS